MCYFAIHFSSSILHLPQISHLVVYIHPRAYCIPASHQNKVRSSLSNNNSLFVQCQASARFYVSELFIDDKICLETNGVSLRNKALPIMCAWHRIIQSVPPLSCNESLQKARGRNRGAEVEVEAEVEAEVVEGEEGRTGGAACRR